MSVRWVCRPHLLPPLLWATQGQLSVSSSHRSSYAAVAVSGSAAPWLPAGPPAPPSMMTWPPPGGALPQHACSPPLDPLLTDEREGRRGVGETGSVCRVFWAARTQRIQKDLESSCDSDRAIPCWFPDEGSWFHWLVENQILWPESSRILLRLEWIQVTCPPCWDRKSWTLPWVLVKGQCQSFLSRESWWQQDELNLSDEENRLLWRQVNGNLWSEVSRSLWSDSSWLWIAETLSLWGEESLCSGGEESHCFCSSENQMTC